MHCTAGKERKAEKGYTTHAKRESIQHIVTQVKRFDRVTLAMSTKLGRSALQSKRGFQCGGGQWSEGDWGALTTTAAGARKSSLACSAESLQESTQLKSVKLFF